MKFVFSSLFFLFLSIPCFSATQMEQGSVIVIGAGTAYRDYPNSFLLVDINADSNPDLILDITKPLPGHLIGEFDWVVLEYLPYAVLTAPQTFKNVGLLLKEGGTVIGNLPFIFISKELVESRYPDMEDRLPLFHQVGLYLDSPDWWHKKLTSDDSYFCPSIGLVKEVPFLCMVTSKINRARTLQKERFTQWLESRQFRAVRFPSHSAVSYLWRSCKSRNGYFFAKKAEKKKKD